MAMTGRNFVINLLANPKPAETAFKKVGQDAGRLATPVGIATAAITASFAVVVGVVGKVGKELFDLGQQFDDVYDNIRIQTGMTGDALGALQDSFRDVARQVPNDFGDIGIAIQDLNTRLGVSGDDLEGLAIQLLTVSRLMGGDVESNVRVATRLFGDFGVAAEDQADTLDMLFRASQASGQSFDTLADQTVNYGADLRALGFDLPRAVSALALFERTGVNTETVMSGLRLAVSNLAKEGQDIPTAFNEAITTIRDAETEAEAFGVAVELVGTRYASNFLDTIRGGKFDLDEFIAQITTGSETIETAAEDTDGFRESWEEFKNYLKVVLEPAAAEVFAALEGFVNRLRPAAEEVMEAYEEGGLKGALEQIAIEWDKIYDEYLQPLWWRFLDFLEFEVLPEALTLGRNIGSAIGSGLQNALAGFLSNVAERMLNIPLPPFQLWGRGIRELADALETEMPSFGDGQRRIPIVDVVPELPSGLDYGEGGLPLIPNPRQPSGPSTGLPPGVEYGRGGLPVIPAMGRGGLVSSPTLALVGEAGPEVVVPLDRVGGLGTTVNVTVTSADPEAVVDAIRRYTRSNGPLGQVVRV